ncbi:glycosyltransferase family 1 protein [bacterium]|nr:glycosyltransferase family 1 protein [bacterium]NBX48987.1 glycosyltransferase family 1 protein [bacterium]
MRLGIDARMFGPRVGGGGIGRYIAELVMHLQEIDKETEYVVFLKKENFHDFVIKRKNFSKRLVDIPWYSVREQFAFPKEILLSKVQAMHYPHGNVPLWSRVPFIVTLHDLIPLEDRQAAHATTRNAIMHGVKYAAFRHVLEHAVHASRHIVAVSDATKRSILSHFRVKPQKISVVYQGVKPPAYDKQASIEGMGVNRPYVLALGNMYPHKNQGVLLEALKECEDMPQLQLVFAGRYDAFGEKVKKTAERLGVSERVRFIHAPTDGEIHALITHASLVAHPARIEGFGIPPLEAALLKTPIAVSDIPIFHETLKESAQFVPAEDPSAWAAVMKHAVEAPEAWNTLIASAARQAKRYNWEECAKEMKEVYLTHAFPRL